MATKYKLTYFNVRGRAETIRMLFAAAGVEFEDVRIAHEQWPELKPKMPHHYLPVLEVNGTQISQSLAIVQFVAKEVQLYGKNNLEAAFIDQITETLRDLVFIAGHSWFSEKDERKKAELRAKFLDEDVPKNLKLIENDIAKFGKDGFAVSKELSLADIAIFTTTEFLQLRDCLGDYPRIAASIKEVEENKHLAKYLKERPDAPF